jgi:hypothetical protein
VERWRTALNKSLTTFGAINIVSSAEHNTEITMLIVIEEAQLKDIIISYLHETMQGMADWHYDVNLIAGRGDNGHRAEIGMSPPAATPAPVAEEATPSDDEAAVEGFSFGESD